MENYSKMSELASTELKDVQTVKILICYLLYRINKPVDSEQLYDIAVTTEIINYFFYQDAMDYLIKIILYILRTEKTIQKFIP